MGVAEAETACPDILSFFCQPMRTHPDRYIGLIIVTLLKFADFLPSEAFCVNYSLQYHVDLQAEANQLARRERLPTSRIHRSVAPHGCGRLTSFSSFIGTVRFILPDRSATRAASCAHVLAKRIEVDYIFCFLFWLLVPEHGRGIVRYSYVILPERLYDNVEHLPVVDRHDVVQVLFPDQDPCPVGEKPNSAL